MSIKKLQLTNEGELLVLRDSFQKSGELPDNNISVGHHEECGGLINILPVTGTMNIFHCNICGLRVYFPKYIKKFTELQSYLFRKFQLIQGGWAAG